MQTKHYLLGSLLALVGMVSCGDSNDNVKIPDDPNGGKDEPTEEPTEEPITVVDLSEPGMANCYIVQAPGVYKFKADNQFNLGEGLPVPHEISPVSASLVWQSGKDLISNISLDTEGEAPYIQFEVTQAEGNALIAALDSNGEIAWSWHIWMPVEDITSIPSTMGYDLMNLNLGAMHNDPKDAGCYGMLYQWGRKDPFPASATMTGDTNTLSAPMYDIDNEEVKLTYSSWTDNSNNTIAYSISHPMEVLSNYSQMATSVDWLKAEYSDDSLWGNPNGNEKDEAGLIVNKGRKTCYDPSPYGWKVPASDVFLKFTSYGGYSWELKNFNIADSNGDGEADMDDYNYGWWFMVNDTESLFFPAASRFDGSYAMLMGSMSGLWGNYWSNTPAADMAGGAFSPLAFQVKDMMGNDAVSVSSAATAPRANAFSIKCVRDN